MQSGKIGGVAATAGRSVNPSDSTEKVFVVASEPGKDPRADALAQKGQEHLKAGRVPAAIAKLKEALALEPGNLTALNRYSVALTHLEPPRFDEARTFVDKALALDPEYPNALYNRAVDLFRQGRVDAALDLLTKVVAKGDPFKEGARGDSDLDALRPSAERLAKDYNFKQPQVTAKQQERFAQLIG
jgi:Flp pilus assembly protein TadD